jgi:hypothetical protein
LKRRIKKDFSYTEEEELFLTQALRAIEFGAPGNSLHTLDVN